MQIVHNLELLGVLLSEDNTDTNFIHSAFNYPVFRPVSLSLAYLEEVQTTEQIRHIAAQRLQ